LLINITYTFNYHLHFFPVTANDRYPSISHYSNASNYNRIAGKPGFVENASEVYAFIPSFRRQVLLISHLQLVKDGLRVIHYTVHFLRRLLRSCVLFLFFYFLYTKKAHHKVTLCVTLVAIATPPAVYSLLLLCDNHVIWASPRITFRKTHSTNWGWPATF